MFFFNKANKKSLCLIFCDVTAPSTGRTLLASRVYSFAGANVQLSDNEAELLHRPVSLTSQGTLVACLRWFSSSQPNQAVFYSLHQGGYVTAFVYLSSCD